MSSTAKNPSTGRTGSCPYTLASPGMSPRKTRPGAPISFKSTPPPIIAQTRVSRRFQRFRPPFTRTLVHDHKNTDETFIVIEGTLRIDFRDGAVHLSAGEMFVVPKGVEHKPYAEREVKLLLIEPRGVPNTGDAGGERTAEQNVWISKPLAHQRSRGPFLSRHGL